MCAGAEADKTSREKTSALAEFCGALERSAATVPVVVQVQVSAWCASAPASGEDATALTSCRVVGSGARDQDPTNIAGTNKRNRKLDELAGKCSETVQATVRDELQSSFRSILGEADWKISEDPADADRQCLFFAYPLGLEADLYGLGIYSFVVRPEFGCRGNAWPSEQKPIQPYIADALPGLLAQPTAEVHGLRPERTFLEKATLLHAVFHSGKMPPRLSRHHYELSRLYRHEYGQAAIKDVGLLASVVKHKKVFFREAAARYDLARPGTLRVCPPDSHIAQIRSDYRDMREMFFGEAPPFDRVIADLKELEDRVNA